jgi:hypothetical protein
MQSRSLSAYIKDSKAYSLCIFCTVQYSITVGVSFKYTFNKLGAKPNYITNKHVNK